jgi:hypothetical protein
MKKLVLLNLLFCVFAINSSFGQMGEMGIQDVPLIKKSKTYFVLDEEDSTDYNKSMVSAAKKFWKQTNYEFIKYSQLKDYVQKPNTTFIMKLIFSVNTSNSTGNWAYGFNPSTQKFQKDFHRSSPGLNYRYDGIVMVSGEKKKAEFGWKDWLAYALINDINETESYHFKIGSYLQMIQNYITYIEKSGEKNLSLSKAKELYNVNVGKLKNKTLYINPADLPEKIKTIEQIKEAYQYNVKFATPKEIQKAIDSQDENIAVLNNVYTANRYYPYIFEAKGGNVIFLDMDRNYALNPAKSIKRTLTDASTK